MCPVWTQNGAMGKNLKTLHVRTLSIYTLSTLKYGVNNRSTQIKKQSTYSRNKVVPDFAMVRHHAEKWSFYPISCVIDLHYNLLKHNEKEVNFSIVLWLNVEIESLFTLLDSSAWLLTCDHIYNIFISAQTQCQINLYTSKKDVINCPVHHHCDLYLHWNFEKQIVPCKTVMQLARKLRTDSSGVLWYR